MIGLIDMTFGAILCGLYIQSLVFFPAPKSYSVHDDYDPNAFQVPYYRLFLIFPIMLNMFQIMISYQLVSSVKQADPLVSLAKSTLWLQGSLLTLTFLICKIFIEAWDPEFVLNPTTHLSLTISFWEAVTKMVGMYLVRKHLDKLKMLSNSSFMDVHFYPVYVNTTSTADTSLSPPSSPNLYGNSSNCSSPPPYTSLVNVTDNFPAYVAGGGGGRTSETSSPVYV